MISSSIEPAPSSSISSQILTLLLISTGLQQAQASASNNDAEVFKMRRQANGFGCIKCTPIHITLQHIRQSTIVAYIQCPACTFSALVQPVWSGPAMTKCKRSFILTNCGKASNSKSQPFFSWKRLKNNIIRLPCNCG
jgi:hypothetical protein